MSLDKTLLNLKILGCVPPHGRIRRAHNGVIAIEEPSMLVSIKRFLFSDGRRSTLEDIYQILHGVSEKINDIITSKYMEFEDGHPKYPDEFRSLLEIMTILEKELKGAIDGLENLKVTYHDDATVISELDIIATRMRLVHDKLRLSM